MPFMLNFIFWFLPECFGLLIAALPGSLCDKRHTGLLVPRAQTLGRLAAIPGRRTSPPADGFLERRRGTTANILKSRNARTHAGSHRQPPTPDVPKGAKNSHPLLPE